MEESDSGQQQKRCPCGFFGSAQTSGLCSKCYKATVQPDKGQDHLDAKAEIMRNKEHSRVPQYSSHDPVSAASSSSFYHSNTVTSSTSTSTNTDSAAKSTADSVTKQTLDKHDKLSVSKVDKPSGGNIDKLNSGNVSNSEAKDNAVKPTTSSTCDTTDTENLTNDSDKTTAEGNNNSDINRNNGDNNLSDINIANRGGDSIDINITSKEKSNLLETDGGQEKRGVKRDSSVLDEQPATPEKGNGAKSKKRCGVCRCKLELAQRAIGRCKCDNVFCSLHRLPEQHDCQFDHKEDGRREAREKMVKPTRHLGTSFKRLDSDS